MQSFNTIDNYGYFLIISGPRIYKPLAINIALLAVRFGLCRLFRASVKLRILRVNHCLMWFPVVNCGSATGGAFPPIPALLVTYPKYNQCPHIQDHIQHNHLGHHNLYICDMSHYSLLRRLMEDNLKFIEDLQIF